MSKAFTKEDAPGGEEEIAPYQPPWPDDARNYVTPSGLARLKQEHEEVLERTRALPKDARDAIRDAQRRLAILAVHIDSAEVIEPPRNAERAQFGTTITVRREEGDDKDYSIVGVDEVDVERGMVSWLSPIARALREAKVGDIVTLRTPRGEEELEVVRIRGLEG